MPVPFLSHSESLTTSPPLAFVPEKPMAENRESHPFDIVGETVGSFFSQSESLGSAKQRERAARTDAEIQHFRGSRGRHNPHQVINYRVVNRDFANLSLQFHNVCAGHDGAQFVERLCMFTVAQDLSLVFRARIADA